ncbi:hypothetical protein I601_4109 [Nocardioides dokdonensis FR1436]|uniref:DUF3093 domain-containing protein n=1 Tax=Nocardioides dokdonensis FR1436 TaxID=1300347 RepID=A0A1A9GQB2_9ACTN|nr:DUF3093 domain-containing protein [Nocardioides dokdonensis]ANH40504.1 hypothetical protein I601_4109 [Nocardioides dokdonensis FR1436]
MHRQTSGYHERLRVPPRWWIQWTLMVASFWVAMIVAVPEALAWGITTILMVLLTALLHAYGSARIVVTDEWLHAGRARIQLHYLGPTQVLDAPDMRSIAGPEANARAYLLLRPYIRTGVRIAIEDPNDPTPYWLVSSRRPTLLAAALNAAASDTKAMTDPEHGAKPH